MHDIKFLTKWKMHDIYNAFGNTIYGITTKHKAQAGEKIDAYLRSHYHSCT